MQNLVDSEAGKARHVRGISVAADVSPESSGSESPAALVVSLVLSDPDVVAAVCEHAEGPSRTDFLLTALKVGVLSLRAARGTLDGDTLRREGDRLMDELGTRLNTWRGQFEERVSGSLSHYFDPHQGTFMERVHRLTKADGDLANVMRQQVQDARSNLSTVFEQFIGENSQLLRMLDPSADNQLVATLQRTLDGAVEAQNRAILGQFSLDNKDGALVRFLNELTAKHGDINNALAKNLQAVVAEFSLDDENSALSRLVTRVESAQENLAAELSLDNADSALQRLQKMLGDHYATIITKQTELAARLEGAIATMAARREAAFKGTQHGLDFEEALRNHLREITQAAGDILEDTGMTTGLKPNCKVGDHVVTLGPEKLAAGARIVIEAKENASYDLTRTLEEAHTARTNRQADTCVFVHSVKTAPPGIPDFQRYGRDIVVRWNADDDALDVWLQAALMVATALAVKAASHDRQDAASFEKIDRAIERIRKALEGFDEINTSANTTRSAAEKILNRARLMQESLSSQIQAIVDEISKVKEETSTSV